MARDHGPGSWPGIMARDHGPGSWPRALLIEPVPHRDYLLASRTQGIAGGRDGRWAECAGGGNARRQIYVRPGPHLSDRDAGAGPPAAAAAPARRRGGP